MTQKVSVEEKKAELEALLKEYKERFRAIETEHKTGMLREKIVDQMKHRKL